MRRKVLHSILAFLVFGLFATLSGCGGSSSSSSGTGASIAGLVSDGYVSNASVTVYSDAAMATQIGSGSTDSSGNFSVTLTVASVPDPVYVKTTGGIDMATGLAAPTMFYAGSYNAGSLNVTPITNQAFSEYQKDPSSGLDAAYAAIAAKLGITTDNAKADVVANDSAKNAMYEVLSAGTTGTTLPDGNYEVKFISFLQSDIESLPIDSITGGDNPLDGLVRTFNISVSNGNLSGTSDTGEFITGRVQGTTIIMNMVTGDEIPTLYRLAGEITFGAASGTCNQLMGGNITNGLFLATFTPATITEDQITNLFTTLANIQMGQHYFATRDFLINGVAPFTSYGWITLSGLNASGFDYTGFTNNTVMDNDNLFETWSDVEDAATFLSGSRIYAFAYEYDTGGDPETIIVIGAAGNRKCLGVTTYSGSDYTVRSVVEVTLVRNTAIAPLIKSATTYNIYVAVAHAGLLNQARADNLAGMVFSGGQMVTPEFDEGLNVGFAFNPVGGENIVMAGSTLMIKKCENFNGPLNAGEYVMGLELYNSGAMSGTRVDGGTIGELIQISDYPSTNVVFMRETAAPDFSGTLNFVSRTLYSLDYTNYANNYAYGTITLNTTGSSATLSCTSGAGDAISTTLTLEKVLDGGNFSGIVHLYGSLGGDNGYIDIYWPVGGKKATYVSSESATGITFDVGEAYLTF